MLGENPDEATDESETVGRPPGLQQQVGLGPDADHHRRRDHERASSAWPASPSSTPRGSPSIPAKVGGVLPGSPAYKAGLRAGDEIVAIDGRREVGFKDLLSKVSLSGAGQKIKFTVSRPGSEAEKVFEIEPLRDAANPMPTIGVLIGPEPRTLLQAAVPGATRAGRREAEIQPRLRGEGQDRRRRPDRAARSSRSAIRSTSLGWSTSYRDQNLVVEVERKKGEADEPTTLAKVTVPPHRFLDFGLTPDPRTDRRGPPRFARPEGRLEGGRPDRKAVDGDPDYSTRCDCPTMSAIMPASRSSSRFVRDVDGKPTRRSTLTVTPDASPTWVGAGRPRPSRPARHPRPGSGPGDRAEDQGRRRRVARGQGRAQGRRDAPIDDPVAGQMARRGGQAEAENDQARRQGRWLALGVRRGPGEPRGVDRTDDRQVRSADQDHARGRPEPLPPGPRFDVPTPPPQDAAARAGRLDGSRVGGDDRDRSSIRS